MCTKAVSVNVRAMSERLKAPVVPPKAKNPNLSKQDGSGSTLPTDYTPVITMNRPREIQSMRWGLIPHYTKDPKAIAPMFNARSETLLELPSFRDLVMTRRCLILSEGYHEWEKQDDVKIEWKITPAIEDYFYLAGLWTAWRDGQTNEIIESCTMITCDPGNCALSKVHDRMPIIMNKEERRLWMTPTASKDQVMSLLHPCADNMFSVTEFDRKAIKPPRPKNKGFDF